MASIPGCRFDITGASGSQGLLSPKASWRAYIFPRGGHASQDSTGTLITFDSASVASRFAANNWIQVGLQTANIRQVSAVGGNSLSVSGAAVTVAENDRIFLIGTTQPTVVGGSATYTVPNTLIRQRDDDAGDLYTNSMVTSNSDGLIQFWAAIGIYDAIIQDGNQSNQGSIVDIDLGETEGVSVSTAAAFGSSVVIHGALGVTGWATFGSTVTMHAALGVTGWAHFGSTVTMHANAGVTGSLVVGGTFQVQNGQTIIGQTITVSGGFSGTAIIPRLGQASTPTGGGAIRIVEGNVFPLTVAGVQAALNECKAAGGGSVWVPNNAGITITTTSIKIPNRVRLIGMGSAYGSSYTFIMSAATNLNACIENETQDGTQQYAALDNIALLGNASAGCTVGVLFKQVYDGSHITNCLVTASPNKGVVIEGGAAGAGNILIQNNNFSESRTNNLHITGRANFCNTIDTLTANIITGNSNASVLVSYDSAASASANFGHIFRNIYVETANTYSVGMHFDGVANCRVDTLIVTGTTGAAGIKVTGITSGDDGVFAASGHVFTNIQSPWDLAVDDRVAGVTVGMENSRFVPFYMSPVAQANIDDVMVVGIQPARKGVAIVSGTTISITDGSFFEITGTSIIANIVPNPRFSGRLATLMFSNASPGGINVSGNVRLAGGVSFQPAQWGCITVVCSGTTWFEASPR